MNTLQTCFNKFFVREVQPDNNQLSGWTDIWEHTGETVLQIMPSILHSRTNCNSKIDQTWVISCTEKNTLNAIKANQSLNIISDLMATASSYYGRLYKVLSNNTQQSITATGAGGEAY